MSWSYLVLAALELLGLITADSTDSRVVTGLIFVLGIALALGMRERRGTGGRKRGA